MAPQYPLDIAPNWTLISLLAGVALAAYLFYTFIVHPNYVSSIRKLPGPKNESLWKGNLAPIFKAEPGAWHEEMVDRYGHVLMYRGMFGSNRLYISDPKALSHILVKRSYDYPKPGQTRGFLKQIFGSGILFAEGEDHVRQRRIMAEPFNQKYVNSYKTTFDDQAEKMLQKLKGEIDSNKDEDGFALIDIISWLSRTTLDVIGLVGFDHVFNSLDNPDSKLAVATAMLIQPRGITVSGIMLQLASLYLPLVGRIPNERANALKASAKLLNEAAQSIIDERKQMAMNGNLDKNDLISRMIKANLETNNPKEMMSDEELSGQVITFLLAGHETSSTTLTWCMMLLSKHPDVQKKLRDEVNGVLEGRALADLSADEISGLKYLDAVVRETLRFIPPVALTPRSSANDDVIPLSVPIKLKDGTYSDSVHVKKGQQIMIGVHAFNRSASIYGDDAKSFNPDRWLEDAGLPQSVKGGFTAFAPILSFLGGPR